MSLTALRRNNKKEGYLQDGEAIHLPDALKWTRNYLIRAVQERPQQYYLFQENEM